MRFSRFFSACLSVYAAAAHNTPRSHALHKRAPVFNTSHALREDPAEMQKRDGTKYVFMHHIVGNTYDYTQDTWADDIQQISAKGVDAIALNIGGDDWQVKQLGYAYAAAQALGSSTKLFISFDFTTSLGCSLSDIVSRTRQFSSHPWQFKVGGKPMISSYSGDCLGNSGWQSLKDQTGAYLMPFIWGLEGNFGSYPSLDSWYCWGCAWPQGDYDKTTDDDNYYIGQLGSKYATTVSMWFYTHLSDKNRLLRSDDWLINARWEQLVAMRNQLTFVEMVTWNDFGESDYFGPVRVSCQPAGTTWAEDYPHTAWFDMSQYYIQAFKTGVYPTITTDVIYYWARPHPHDVVVSGDGARPDNWDWTEDYLWAAAFCSSVCTVTLKCGSSSATFTNQPAGVNKLKIPLAAGQITVSMVKNGQTVISKTEPNYHYVTNPGTYNFNAFVGAAYTSGSTTTTTPITPATTTTSTATTATSTSVAGVSWTNLGCYPDPNSPRTLNNGIHTSTSTNNVTTCLSTCKNAGYVYAGVEYGVECWCASTLTTGVSATSAGECDMGCSSGTGICGGGNRINVYFAAVGLGTTTSVSTTTTSPAATATSTSVAGVSWNYLGCYPDPNSPRTLSSGISTSTNTNSVSTCLTTCKNAGYVYAGVEYGVECWCASAMTAGVSATSEGECGMACSGGTGICGGGNKINIYSAAAGLGTTTTTTTTTNSAPTSTPSWSYLGCYLDTANPRTLNNGLSFTSQTGQSVAGCLAACAGAGYLYGGTEYGVECWCASALSSGASTASGCDMTCSGAPGDVCGGSYRISLYKASTVVTPSALSWSYLGCYQDYSPRTLNNGISFTSATLTIQRCQVACGAAGYRYAGVEYSQECWCSSAITSGAVQASSKECDMSCTGASGQTCGGGNRISLYMATTSSKRKRLHHRRIGN
ncbi:glycosyl hydrolase family 71-domain-containing protein [Mycena latifolia]|nr:glycosyl hydrolase family 71-domain-containing protein [Mycena latifolia]